MELQIRIDEQWEAERNNASNASNVTLEKATEEASGPEKANEVTASETPSLTPTMKDFTMPMMALVAKLSLKTERLEFKGSERPERKRGQ